jgi:hypothetical protein
MTEDLSDSEYVRRCNMKKEINLEVELTQNGKSLSKHDLTKLKKSNPSSEELDKLGVKITQKL